MRLHILVGPAIASGGDGRADDGVGHDTVLASGERRAGHRVAAILAATDLRLAIVAADAATSHSALTRP